MSDVYVPADPADTLVDWFADQLVDRWPDLDTGLTLPTEWSPAAGRPFLIVADDGGSVTVPILTTSTQRVTVWHKDRDVARAIAGRALGLALCTRIPGIATVRPGLGLLDSLDSRNNARVCSFTLRIRARMLAD